LRLRVERLAESSESEALKLLLFCVSFTLRARRLGLSLFLSPACLRLPLLLPVLAEPLLLALGSLRMSNMCGGVSHT
jgi:hypothetical protein